MLESKDHWQNENFWWSFEFDIRLQILVAMGRECQIHSTSAFYHPHKGAPVERDRHIVIRRARFSDAAAACEVMRRSIVGLCSADHHDDPVILDQWLASKTPENVTAWIADVGNRVYVAVDDTNTVLAVGAVRTDGEITLNYVSPDVRFRGVSRAMLAQLEVTARDFGHDSVRLISTETARPFYLAAGYEQVGPPQGKFGTTSSYPMQKRFRTGRERP